jgi:hypothetical protein
MQFIEIIPLPGLQMGVQAPLHMPQADFLCICLLICKNDIAWMGVEALTGSRTS